MDFEGPGKAQPSLWDGRRIIALRAELHLSQEELARMLQIRPKTLRGWEDGRGYAVAWAAPRLDRLERKLGKSQAMTEARKKSGKPAASSPDTQPPEQTGDQRKAPRRARRPARVIQSPLARSAERMQQARELQRLLRRMG